MTSPWKLATAGVALVGATALTTGLTTAYFTSPSAPAESLPAVKEYPAPRPATTSTARYATATSVARPAPAPRGTTTPQVVTASVPQVATPAERPVTVASAPADCATGSDRAWRIAKPGLLGTLVGAGLGAAGGAIADGGKGAGKGALIGGIAGAAVGSGYGAYNTNKECGTIFGGNGGSVTGGSSAVMRDRSETPQAALQPAAGDQITVYRVR